MNMKQKRVWLLAGPPGCGKSTWARKRIAEYDGVYCSRDEIRFSLLKDGEDYFSHEKEVMKLWFVKILQALENPEVKDIYIDATHLTEKSRKKVISQLPQGNYRIAIVFFDIPLKVCLKRNEQRKGRAYVPPQVIRDMYASYDMTTILGDDILYIREENENDISNIRYTF